MKRNIRITSGCCSIALLLLLVASCATSPPRHVTLESARRSLQADYPRILQSFDLHQGYFIVSDEAWDTLPGPDRVQLLRRCSQSRQDIVGSLSVVIRNEDRVLATYDGVTPVLYSGPFQTIATQDAAETLDPSDPGPVLVAMRRPVYPREAIAAGVEGTVVVKVLVGEDGQVLNIVVVGDGIPALNGAAVAAASEAHFLPAVAEGHPIAAWLQIPLRFSIMGKRERPSALPHEPGTVGLASTITVPPGIGELPGGKYTRN
jgi:TonB family protein